MARWMLLAALVACGHPAAPAGRAGALATSIDEPHGLAVDPSGVYVASARKLVRLGDSHVFPVDRELEDLAVVDRTLYAIADGSQIAAVSLATGELREVGAAKGFVSALAADARGAVWGTSVPNDPHAGSLVAAAPGGEPVPLVTTIRFADAVALDGDSVFWTSGDGVFRIARDGGKVARLLDAPKHTGRQFLRVYRGRVYAASQDGLVAIDAAGGPPVQLVPARPDAWPDQFVVDDRGVYFVDLDASRATRIRRVALTGGAIADVASDAGDVVALAADGRAVYWLDARDRAVVQRAK